MTRTGPPKQKNHPRMGVIFEDLKAYCLSLIAACAAARRAMGTRKGLQET